MTVHSWTPHWQVADIIAFTVLCYDHLITLPAEVRYFWRRAHCSLGVILFLSNRYIALFLHILNVINTQSSPLDLKVNVSDLICPVKTSYSCFRCGILQVAEQAGILLVQTICSALMGMRVYALYDRSRLILAFLCIVALGVLGFGFRVVFLDNARSDAIASVCTPSQAIAIRTAIAWSGQLAFDAIVFVLTVWKSYYIGKVGDRLLIDILLRDGSIYFAIISIANAVTIATLLLASPPFKQITGTLNNALNVVMVSRLVLNLQEPRRRGSVERTESGFLAITTFLPLDDVPLSMYVDDSDLGFPRAGGIAVEDSMKVTSQVEC